MTSSRNDSGPGTDDRPRTDDGIADYTPIADGATVGSPSSDGTPARADAGLGAGMDGGDRGNAQDSGSGTRQPASAREDHGRRPPGATP